MSNNDAVVVYTSEPRSNIIDKKGSGDWTANINELAKAEYLLCVKNDKNRFNYEDTDEDIKRGQAFLIGKIKSVSSLHSSKRSRKKIYISAYALLPDTNINAWHTITNDQQNPIKYINIRDELKKIDLNLDNLEWKKFEMDKEISSTHEEYVAQDLHELINEVRKKIAEVAKVPQEKVTIKIEF